MKKCTSCKETKDLTEFWRWKRGKDGYHHHCKICRTQYKVVYNQKNVEKLKKSKKEYDLFRISQEKIKNKQAQDIRYKKNNPEKVNQLNAIYAKKNPHVRRAMWRVQNALRSGKLIRQPCEVCTTDKSYAFHKSYGPSLDIRWVCRICHGKEQREKHKLAYLIKVAAEQPDKID